jgi:hypothetical protein
MTKYQKIKLIIIAVFSFLLLLILNNYSRNGRYASIGDQAATLDTRTGTIYFTTPSNYKEIKNYKNIDK